MELNKKISFIIMGITFFTFLNLFKAKKAEAENFGIKDKFSIPEIYEIAKFINKKYFPKIDPVIITTIAEVESAGNSKAYRIETKINDASIGLMQVLKGTANWMFRLGYKAYNPNNLLNAETSVYFGTAYLEYNRNYNNQARTEEFIIRSYNGGSGTLSSATKKYYDRYLQEKKRVKTILKIK